jgi:hypothetical protein
MRRAAPELTVLHAEIDFVVALSQTCQQQISRDPGKAAAIFRRTRRLPATRQKGQRTVSVLSAANLQGHGSTRIGARLPNRRRQIPRHAPIARHRAEVRVRCEPNCWHASFAARSSIRVPANNRPSVSIVSTPAAAKAKRSSNAPQADTKTMPT